MYTPSTATAEDALPLILNFHGNPSDAETHADYTNMDLTAENYGFYVVYPEGLNEAFNAGGCCADATADDLGFARDLVAYIAAHACIDLDRVYATGFSNGGYSPKFRILCLLLLPQLLLNFIPLLPLK